MSAQQAPAAPLIEQLFSKLSSDLTLLVTKVTDTLGRLTTVLEQLLKPASPGAPPFPPGTIPLERTDKFLWKPRSDKDKKLVILLPKQLGKAKSVELIAPDRSTVLASGRFSSVANGGRAHYRFPVDGGSFPDGVIVRITSQDGTVREIAIPDTANRFGY